MSLYNLRGIQSGVAPVQRDLSNLEKLTEIIQNSLIQDTTKYSTSEGDRNAEIQLIKEHILTINFPITPTLLQTYVISQLQDEEITTHDTQVFHGVWTGQLLEHIATQNPKTIIEINGYNKTFSYLFSRAKYTGNLILKNLKGAFICINTGERKGKACVYADNIQGDDFVQEILFGAGYDGEAYIYSNRKVHHFSTRGALLEEIDEVYRLTTRQSIHDDTTVIEVSKNTCAPLEQTMLAFLKQLKATPTTEWKKILCKRGML